MAFESVGLVVGKFAPLHKGHQFVLETALESVDHVIVLMYSNPDFPGMPAQVRANWIRTLYPAALVFVPDNPPPNEADDFTQRDFVRRWLETHASGLPNGGRVDLVFGSDAYLTGFAQHIGAFPKVVDAARQRFTISGTQIRSDVHAHRHMLDPHVYQHFVERVVFLGAESTGKSTLTERMALEYNTVFVPEYGREVWERQNGQLELEDYIHIARRHRELEDERVLKANRYLFVDTNAITTMFLGYAYEGNGLPELTSLAQAAETRYHHVFLCADDIAFHQDGWRDDHVWRSRAQGMIRYDLAVRGVAYTVVSGSLEDRVGQVKQVLEARQKPLQIMSA
jgi:NadR type nicotinamide-nucleotide adenylyltransferase